jgi:hypothetical protein
VKRRHAMVCVGLSLLLVYGAVLPNVFIGHVAAHRLGWSLVRSGHLRYYDGTGSRAKFGNLIQTAEDQWSSHIDIEIREVSNQSSADVILTSFCGPNTDLLGGIYREIRTIKFNRCLLNHKGGRVEGKNGKPSKTSKPATHPTRKQRTFVHEFGHALGLDHTPNLLHRESVMSEILKWVGPSNSPFHIRNFTPTIYKPTSHDIQDIKDLWP